MNTHFLTSKQVLITAAAIALTACSSAVTVTGHKNLSGSYEPSELYVVAGGDNELRTIIVGNPFGQTQAEFERTVLASLKGRNFGPELNLSTSPRQEDPRKRHVVLVFNLQGYEDAHDLCRGATELTTTPASDGALSVTAAYCAGDLPLSQARARSGEIASPDSERFQAMMSQLAFALFPSFNRRSRQRGD